MEKIRNCKRHGETIYTLTSQKKWRCKKCNIETTIEHRRKLKRMAIEYKGGKCQICNYDKSIYALDFHHLDKNQKDFSIANKSYSWERIKSELDKCILVCSNCHREIHEKNGGSIY